MNDMIVTFALFLLAFVPQSAVFTGEWLLTWDQMGTQYIRVSVTQEGAAARVTWENESLECALTNNVCEGAVTENGNPKAGKVKITMNGDEIKGEGADLEGAFTFIGKRPPAPPPGGSRTHKFEPTTFYNYFAWNIAPALHIFPGDTVETKSVDAGGIDENGVRRAPGGRRMAWRYAGRTSETPSLESWHGRQRHWDRPECARAELYPRPENGRAFLW
jgi:amidase